MKVLGQCYLEATIEMTQKEIKFLIVMGIGMKVIIGTETLKEWEIRINFVEEVLQIQLQRIPIEI
jgi:hypothetical protein